MPDTNTRPYQQLAESHPFLNLHVLHTAPFSSLNHDQDGNQKSGLVGNYDRVRISSQAQKRPMRALLYDLLTGDSELGEFNEVTYRTRRLAHLVAAYRNNPDLDLATFDPDTVDPDKVKETADALSVADLKFETGKKLEEDGVEKGGYISKAVFLLTGTAPKTIAQLVNDHEAEWSAEKPPKAKKDKEAYNKFKAEVREALTKSNALVAVFGRFAAEDGSPADYNVEGALAVADAFTIESNPQVDDLFTAVDDLTRSSAAAHMGVAQRTAGVYYRHAALDRNKLLKNLKDEGAAAQVEAAVIKAFARALPNTKVRSGAHHNFPPLVFAVASAVPQNLSDAFLDLVKPVRDYDTGKDRDVVMEGARRLYAWHDANVTAGVVGDTTAGALWVRPEANRQVPPDSANIVTVDSVEGLVSHLQGTAGTTAA